MASLAGVLATLVNFLMVAFGFSAIIFVHELGHFLAARWARIRVLAFAIGFGPALVSYRPGLGFRKGSSQAEYKALWGRPGAPAGLSHTEYRLNALPFGGYVRMLGQEDGDPSAVSSEPDSFQMVLPWKRLIVISAGVVMNIFTAILLFILVFNLGLPVTPAAIGDLEPGRPAAKATATNAKELKLAEADAHLRPGDRIVRVNGEPPNSYSDIILAASMAGPGQPVELSVERPGVPGPLRFQILPEPDRISGLLDLGLDPPASGRVGETDDPKEAAEFEERLAKLGFAGVKPGMRLTAVGSRRATPEAPLTGGDFAEAFRASGGDPVPVTFEGAGGPVTVRVTPRPRLQNDAVLGRKDARVPVEHLLGLTPVMTVEKVAEGATASIRDGDIFARIGAVEFPSLAQGMAEIQGHAGKTLALAVLRREGGELRRVSLEAKVTGKGTIGFLPSTTVWESTLLSRPPESFVGQPERGASAPPAAARLNLRPGARISAVEGQPTANFAEVRAALVAATKQAAASGGSATVRLTIEPPAPGETPREVSWVLLPEDVAVLHQLGWRPPVSLGMFKGEEVILRASSAADAVRLGLRETRRVMLQTYVTFARLFQGTVKVEHLQGPVGIAHIGTVVASRGIIWLLFFLALISVNIAVVNFLPLPIVDGGQFLMILYEQVRGKPLPIKVQEVVTIAGLLFIGVMFLLVTFNDFRKLLGL
jgi:regulator of sigma E protease